MFWENLFATLIYLLLYFQYTNLKCKEFITHAAVSHHWTIQKSLTYGVLSCCDISSHWW